MSTKPNVTRDSLPHDREELHLFCEDSPARPGNEPQAGDSDYRMMFPLHDGRRLVLHGGRSTHENFVAMLAAWATDDADEGEGSK
jgi:hypothetical protein